MIKHLLQRPALSYSLLLALGLMSTPLAQAQDQQKITPDPAAIDVDAGSEFAVTLLYDTSDGNAKLTGLGLRMHYDSSKLTWVDNGSILPLGLLATDTVSQPDTDDVDHDPSTDRYVGIGWMLVDSHWPNGSLPVALYQAHFLSQMAPGQHTQINFTSSSTAAGYEFSSTPVHVSGNVPGT